jgi:hypothetical protein
MQCADRLPAHRADTRRMPKNSLDSIWTLWKRNFFRLPTPSLLIRPRREVYQSKNEKRRSRMEVGRRNRMVVTRTVSLFAWICLIGTDDFIVGQNGGITDNSHIWWQIPFHPSSTSTKRLGSSRGLAGLATQYPSMADLTISATNTDTK